MPRHMTGGHLYMREREAAFSTVSLHGSGALPKLQLPILVLEPYSLTC